MDENLYEKGCAHFTEHILFKGTEKYSTADIAKAFDKIGGNVNAFTEKETTCFHCTFPSRHFDYAIDILADMLFHPLFDLEEIEKEKSVVINEIREGEDTPEDLSYELYMERMWPDHPLGCKITGTEKEVSDITRDTLLAFYRKRYIAENLLVAVAGNFDPDHLVKKLDQIISLPHGEMASLSRIAPVPHTDISFLNSSSQQIQIYAGTSFPVPKDPHEYYAALVFSTMAGESMSSRLYQKIREEMGLCYGIYSFRSFFPGASMWTVYLSTFPENVLTSLRTISSELSDMKNNSFRQSELSDAITHMEGELTVSCEDTEVRMKRLARQFIFFGYSFSMDDAFGYLEEISMSDIDSFLGNHIRSENFNVMVYGRMKKSLINESGKKPLLDF